MGDVSFHGLPLATAPGRVMTPRAASEQLVATALERLGERPVRVADVGTGSGALSRCAVAVACVNVRRHGLGGRVRVRHGDLLEPVPRPVELIVANLPYLPSAAATRYPDLADEPSGAVFAPGDGLDPYRRLAAASEAWLSPEGALAIQLHRRVIVTGREELAELRAALRKTWLPALASKPRLAGATA